MRVWTARPAGLIQGRPPTRPTKAPPRLSPQRSKRRLLHCARMPVSGPDLATALWTITPGSRKLRSRGAGRRASRKDPTSANGSTGSTLIVYDLTGGLLGTAPRAGQGQEG